MNVFLLLERYQLRRERGLTTVPLVDQLVLLQQLQKTKKEGQDSIKTPLVMLGQMFRGLY